jgi:branched-chain amino acid transport system ATP-binding protein
VTETTDPRALLVADDVTAGYLPGVDILNGVNLTLDDGELVGIIGPNGAGKSTLIKAIFGLVDVRSGSVTLGGDDISNLPAHDLVGRGVGYVPQRANVFPSLTVEDNLRMGLDLNASCSPCWRNAPSKRPDISRAGSARWWRSVGR